MTSLVPGLFWTTLAPAKWPDPPAEMTVSTLVDIEACPRRWALAAADYPALWTGRGYPPRVQFSALAGSVVHIALQEITTKLALAGCTSVQDPAAIHVMKALGGFTKVVANCVDRLVERLNSNPRARHLTEVFSRSLRAQVPELRTSVQTILSRVSLTRVEPTRGGSMRTGQRGPLVSGVYTELSLRAKHIGWKGRVDLLVLSPETCEITDFKTGAAVDEHNFQIRVYALLWNRDIDLNPEGRLADRLVLTYSNGTVDVQAPTATELEALEAEITSRRDIANGFAAQNPPEARPKPANCQYCGVRQLCSEYWMTEAQRTTAQLAGEGTFGDVDATIVRQHGPFSWDALVEASPVVGRGQVILVRTGTSSVPFGTGQRLRLLGVRLSTSEEQTHDSVQSVIATIGAGSEAFVVS